MERIKSFGDQLAEDFPELARETGLTRTITFQVTDSCNLACSYCYQINKGTRVMDFSVAKKFIDELLTEGTSINAYTNKDNSLGLIVEFIGGEPLLEVDLIDQIVDYLREQLMILNHPWQHRFCLSMASNGTLYFTEKVQKFLQKNYDVLSLSITVDGTKELHDSCRRFPDGKPSYDLAHAAAQDWIKRGYKMGSKITLAPANVQYMAECLQTMIADGYDEILMNTVYEKGWEVEHATEIYNQTKAFTAWLLDNFDPHKFTCSFFDPICGKPQSPESNDNWCGGVGYMLGVDPDGFLYPCIRYMESSIGNDQLPFRIGNVYDGLYAKPEECERRDCMECVTRRSQSSDQCFYCPISTSCGWCSAYNYQVTGTINKRVTYNCIVHKARVLSSIYFWNTIHQHFPDIEAVDMWIPESWAIPIIGNEDYQFLVNLTEACGKFVNRVDGNKVVIDRPLSLLDSYENVLEEVTYEETDN